MKHEKYGVGMLFRAYYRIATLFHHTMQLQIEGGENVHEMTNLRKCTINKAIKKAKKNFVLLVSMILLFVVFWYPLFLLTLSDPHFKAHASIY